MNRKLKGEQSTMMRSHSMNLPFVVVSYRSDIFFKQQAE
jgi:hypothetical protein